MKYLLLSFLFLSAHLFYGQSLAEYNEMVEQRNVEFSHYEDLLFKATSYLMTEKVDQRSEQFQAANKIIAFWMNKDFGLNTPTFGSFQDSLFEDGPQRYLYMVAMIHYALDQKINFDRVLSCKKIEGQKFSEQADVREVQVEGAKLFLAYSARNKMRISTKTNRFSKANYTGELAEYMFK